MNIRVADCMTSDVKVCHPEDSLNVAIHTMWENDCGSLPVVDASGRVVGMVTDRDAVMCALFRGETLAQMPVSAAMARDVASCQRDEPAMHVAELMKLRQVRRIPVVDRKGELCGVVTLADLIRTNEHVGSGAGSEALLEVIATICLPRVARGQPQGVQSRSATPSASIGDHSASSHPTNTHARRRV